MNQWLIADTFCQEWRFHIVAVGERASVKRISRWDLPREPLFHLLPQAFDEWGARDDEAARDLLSIYDALTGSCWADELPIPTSDRRRRLRGFLPELSRVLYAALEQGVLQFERYQVPWPFPEKDERPEARPQQQAPREETTFVVVQLVDPKGEPVAGVRVDLTGPDGQVHSGTTNKAGEVRVEGVEPGTFDLTLPELEGGAWSAG
ncbi:carboxypeptidase-like regulatory domain-containing protein [Pendulispora brunnea]|uniref:Carboxypeptidase-like regulatory domain-containing protein n=1 Tax=Pendulispora brunnea TaxID=2905690 RepID=A0ABZ2KKV5_9BACT